MYWGVRSTKDVPTGSHAGRGWLWEKLTICFLTSRKMIFFLLLLFNCFCRAVMACIQLILAYLMFELISLVGLLRSYKFLKHLTMKPRLNFFVSCLKVGDLSLG